MEFGSVLGALISLGFDGEDGAVDGAQAGAERPPTASPPFSEDDTCAGLENIPDGSAAAVVLLEHRCAVCLWDAVRAGGSRLRDGFISPLDLIGVGPVTGRNRLG